MIATLENPPELKPPVVLTAPEQAIADAIAEVTADMTVEPAPASPVEPAVPTGGESNSQPSSDPASSAQASDDTTQVPPADPAPASARRPRKRKKVRYEPDEISEERRQQLSHLADLMERGDVAGFLEATQGDLRNSNLSTDARRFWKGASEAIDNLAKKDPALLAETLLARGLAETGIVLLHCHAEMHGLLQPALSFESGEVKMPPRVVEVHVPRMLALQAEIRALSKALGTLRHVVALAGEKKEKPDVD